MKLQKPGAGLPKIENLVIKRLFIPMLRVLITWGIALFLLKREVKIIEKLLKSLSVEERTKQAIIDRTFAIEDDTRRYSVNMTLEHLCIAGETVFNVIKSLSKEEEYKEKVTIEGVKAFENNNNQLEDFLIFYNKYFLYIKEHNKKQSSKTKAHPWFINFNNYDWSVFMYMHTFIHRRQIQAIIKEIK